MPSRDELHTAGRSEGRGHCIAYLTHMQFEISFDTAKFGLEEVIPSALFLQAVAAEVTKLQTLEVRTRLLADFGALRCECWV